MLDSTRIVLWTGCLLFCSVITCFPLTAPAISPATKLLALIKTVVGNVLRNVCFAFVAVCFSRLPSLRFLGGCSRAISAPGFRFRCGPRFGHQREDLLAIVRMACAGEEIGFRSVRAFDGFPHQLSRSAFRARGADAGNASLCFAGGRRRFFRRGLSG